MVVFTLSLVLGFSPSSAEARATEAETADDATLLAERYAPVIMLKAQEQPCDPDGEPYAPTAVEIVLDNPEVLLRQVGSGNPVVQRGPNASDLFELGQGFFLDFPGSSLEPGCIYQTDFDRFTRDLPPVVYAHIVQQDAYPDQLAVQYWFYWYYNDWNNKHESDWEGIQLLFDASSITEALQTEPTSVGYAQHEGGELATWDSSKLERSGSHPVVYSSAGSHASYLSSAVYLGRGASEGFGCDTTTGPSDRVEPQVVVLPDQVQDPTDEFAWLEFGGRWGERQKGAFNGPTGPTAKGRWLDPVDWQDELRSSSVVIPGGEGGGAAVIQKFCDVVETGSGLLISLQVSPFRLVLAIVLSALLVRWLIGRTDWQKVPSLPLRRRRSAGQILRSAADITGRHWRQLALFGVVYLPIVFVTTMLATLLARLPYVDGLLDLAGTSSVTGLFLTFFAGGIPHLIALVTVNALAAVLLNQDEIDRPELRGEAIRQVLARWRDLAIGLTRVILVVIGLLITIVGVPFAFRQLIRYQFMPQVVMLEGLSGRDALRRSSEVVQGRWWHTASVIAVINAAFSTVALVVGLLVLVVFAGLPLWLFSGLITLAFALVVPTGAVAQTLLYGDAVSEKAEAEQPTPLGATV